jgi:2-dehydropantoate 2-reductase
LRALGHSAVATVVYSACERVGPTTIAHRSNGMLITDDRRVATYLLDHGIAAKVTDDLRTALWRKLLANVVVNSFCALLRTPMGLDRQPRTRRADPRRRRRGAALADNEADAWPQNLAGADPATRPSTLQDVEAGRPLEVDALSGAVLRRANTSGIETPTLTTIDALLRALSGGV